MFCETGTRDSGTSDLQRGTHGRYQRDRDRGHRDGEMLIFNTVTAAGATVTAAGAGLLVFNTVEQAPRPGPLYRDRGPVPPPRPPAPPAPCSF